MIVEKVEDNWKEVGECFHAKYFVCDDPTSDKYRTILRRLTDEEFKIYDIGVVIDGYLRVVGFGYKIYINTKTGEDMKVNYQKM